MSKLLLTVSFAAMAGTMLTAAGPAYAQDDEGDVIVVRGALVPDEKQNTSEISSLLDAEDFERTGDSDIASALSRVTGLSITDGKFPVARGLNERYSTATLNGVPLPSPEPLRRAVPLDIIPTNVLAGSLAQKTFSPEYSGEFGGAAIDLRTLKKPNDDFLKLSISGEIDTESTLRNGYFYDGSDTDVLGYDDGLRDLPDLVASEIAAGELLLSPEARASFDQLETLVVTEDNVPMNGSGSATFGKLLVDNGDVVLGTVNHFGYSNKHTMREGSKNRTIDGGQLSNDERSAEFTETRQEAEFNALSSTGIEFANGDHELSLTALLLRSTLKTAEVSDVVDDAEADGEVLRNENTQFIEREVWQAQLGGNHFFADLGDLEATWAVAYGEAKRESPYERQTSRVRDDVFFGPDGTSLTPIDGVAPTPTYIYRPSFDDNYIKFSDVNDENFFGRVDFTLPVEAGNFPIEFRFGGAYTDNSRTTGVNEFRIQSAELSNPIYQDLTILRTDLLYRSELMLDPDLFDIRLVSSRLQPDATDASLEVTAGYLMADIELSPYIRASIGGRYEESTQETATFRAANGIAPEDIEAIEEEYFLPAGTITWNPTGNIQLRLAASKTITRPQFRELAATVFTDPDLDVPLLGNPFLQNSELLNLDARAEWYFRRGEFLTLGVFYKDIDNPIERFTLGDEAGTLTYVNSESAEIWGIEAEFEKRLVLDEMFDSATFDPLELVLVTNYTYTDSEVTPGAAPTLFIPGSGAVTRTNTLIPGHSLEGQSDHLFNFQIGVENVDTESKATLLVNYASERTLATGDLRDGLNGIVEANEVIETPPVSVDFVVTQNVEFRDANYSLGVSVRNILGEDFNAYREVNDGMNSELPFLEYDRGTKFSVSLSREF